MSTMYRLTLLKNVPLNILKVASSWNECVWPTKDQGIDSILVYNVF